MATRPAPPSSPSRSRAGEADDSTGRTASRAGHVALIGRPNVGKSTLLNALLGERIAITSPHPQTTRDAGRGVLTVGATQYVFVDTPGLHAPRTLLGQRMNDVARRHARAADVVVLVTEAPRELELPVKLHPIDASLAGECASAPVVLVVNKADRLADKTTLLPHLAAFAEVHPFAAIVPLSAREEGDSRRRAAPLGGLARLLAELRALLPEQPFLLAEDTLSDQPARYFAAEYVREQILRHTRQEVPHGVAVVIDRFDDAVHPPRIEATIHVSREGHTKIVVGAKGQVLKRIGMDARARLERTLGTPVNLRLRVRATPGWMNDELRLRELGYGPLDT